jgi:thymidylate synthase
MDPEDLTWEGMGKKNVVVEPTAAKKYYNKNRDIILAKEKTTKRWLDYYQRNKEKIRQRNIERYYEKQGRERPTAKAKEPPDTSKIEKLEALVAELRELVPHVMKPKRTKKAAPRFD